MMRDAIILVQRNRGKGLPEITHDVLGEVRSSGQKEDLSASQKGMKAEKTVKIWKYDFKGETVAVVEGKRLSIYRSFVDGNFVYLYCGEKAGTR